MSYFNGRGPIYETEKGKQHYRITWGVPRGSVLELLLWKKMYDALLKTKFPSRNEQLQPSAAVHDISWPDIGKSQDWISVQVERK